MNGDSPILPLNHKDVIPTPDCIFLPNHHSNLQTKLRDSVYPSFRYPTDKVNNIYIFELENSKKEEIIEDMKKSIEISCKILNDHIEGVSRDLTLKRNVLKEFVDKYK
jgi:hypothetical protein